MPMIVPNALVIEDFSQPLVQGDGSAIVNITTYVDGKSLNVRQVKLDSFEMEGVANTPSIPGMTVIQSPTT